MQINLLGQRNLLGAGRHFSSFCDAFKLLNVVGDAVHEFDVFSREDYEKCMASVDTGDVNIHFFDIKKIPSSLLKIRWPNYQELIGIGRYLSLINCSLNKLPGTPMLI